MLQMTLNHRFHFPFNDLTIEDSPFFGGGHNYSVGCMVKTSLWTTGSQMVFLVRILVMLLCRKYHRRFWVVWRVVQKLSNTEEGRVGARFLKRGKGFKRTWWSLIWQGWRLLNIKGLQNVMLLIAPLCSLILWYQLIWIRAQNFMTWLYTCLKYIFYSFCR